MSKKVAQFLSKNPKSHRDSNYKRLDVIVAPECNPFSKSCQFGKKNNRQGLTIYFAPIGISRLSLLTFKYLATLIDEISVTLA